MAKQNLEHPATRELGTAVAIQYTVAPSTILRSHRRELEGIVRLRALFNLSDHTDIGIEWW